MELVFGDHVSVSHSYFPNSQPLDVSDCWNAETRTLSLNNDCLRLTIVKPKQKGESSSKDDLFIEKVGKAKANRLSLRDPTKVKTSIYLMLRQFVKNRLASPSLSREF